MHITYVLCQDSGGLPHYTAELANAVAETEDVTVVKPAETTADEYFDENVELREVFDPLNISVPKIARNEIDPVEVLRSVRSFGNIDVIDELDPDIVHLTASTELFPYMKYFVWRSGVSRNYPFIETFHNIDPDKWLLRLEDLSDVDEDSPLKWLLVNNVKNLVSKSLPTPDRTHSIVHTNEHKQHLIDRGVEPDRIEKIPHGVYEIFNTGQDVETKENSILFFGNIVGRKGPDTLVRSLPLIVERVPDATVVFAGSGTFNEASQKIIKAYDERFEIHNRFIPNDEVGDFHARADLVAFPHRRLVGTSGTLTVAYSFSKPVVTTNVGSFSDLVAGAGTGIVVPPNDPKALADAIVTILNNDNIKQAMKENTVSVKERLSWSRIADQHVRLYRRYVRA